MEITIGALVAIIFSVFLGYKIYKRIKNNEWQWSFLKIFLLFIIIALLSTGVYYLIY